MSANPLEHVADSPSIEIFPTAGWVIHLPNIAGFQITKFMVLELVAGAIMLGIFIPLAKRYRNGEATKGLFDNAFESLLTFIRENVAKPYIGHEDHHTHIHEADKYVPFLWTVFLFVLICNLLGMLPWLGSPTADLSVTVALAVCSFCAIFFVPMFVHGPTKFFKSFLPHADMHGPILIVGFPILLLVAVIEIFGIFIKAFVLAVRLFANMFAGHTVLAVLLMFIEMSSHADSVFVFGGVTIVSVLGVVALSLLELFVAFLQAFVFTFLTALFLGSTLHPEH
ncbi:MAG: F0F1 ATP synthase subunit A [Gemmataceae bacterium]